MQSNVLHILRRINGSLNTITFTKDYVLKVTKKLNSNKARRHDQVSICMLHIYEKSNMKTIIWDYFFLHRVRNLPKQMEMANLEPIYKLDDNQNVKNYRPVSLLPIFRTSYIQ